MAGRGWEEAEETKMGGDEMRRLRGRRVDGAMWMEWESRGEGEGNNDNGTSYCMHGPVLLSCS